jgi:hypothetical protein
LLGNAGIQKTALGERNHSLTIYRLDQKRNDQRDLLWPLAIGLSNQGLLSHHVNYDKAPETPSFTASDDVDEMLVFVYFFDT